MANKFFNGKDYLLYVDVTTPTTTAYTAVTTANAELVGCLDTQGFQMTSSDIDTSSKCSDGNFAESIGGQQGWSMSADGKYTDDVAFQSSNQLFKLSRDNQEAWWFIFDTAKLLMRYGVGRITSFDESMANNEAVTFSISITGVGYPGDQDDITP